MTNWNTKCRFFNEKYACETLSSENYKSCKECKFASPYSKKILILKFDALGDVIRTTSILEAIKKKYGDEVLIYWMTLDESKELLENNPYIDKVLVYNNENILRLQQEKFDILFSLEITSPVTLLANIVKANKKFGYYFDDGATTCFNKGAEEYLETAFLTHVKLENRRTYQELIFDACELEYNKEEPFFKLLDKDYGEKFKKKFLSKKPVVGINFNASERWLSKSWAKEQVKELVKKLNLKYNVILLGGLPEADKLKELVISLQKEKIRVITNDPNNTIMEFASVLNICDKVVTTDSLAMHLSLVLKKPTLALFFSTPPWEIEGYSSLKKITSKLLEKHFFSHKYSEELANSISAEEVLKNLDSFNPD